MSFLNDLINTLTGQHPQPQGQQSQPLAQAVHQAGQPALHATQPLAPSVQNAAIPQREIPVGQAMSPQDISRLAPQIQPLAQIYNQNPQDPRVMHLDPAMFGYAADTAARPPQAPSFASQAPQQGHPLTMRSQGINPYSNF